MMEDTNLPKNFLFQVTYNCNLPDEDDLMDTKYLSGNPVGGYGYRFEFQNCI